MYINKPGVFLAFLDMEPCLLREEFLLLTLFVGNLMNLEGEKKTDWISRVINRLLVINSRHSCCDY